VLFLSRVALGGLLVAAAGIGACTSVRRVQPVEYLADNAPEVVWVTDTNNTVVPVTEAVVTRDTLRGMELSQGRGQRVKIPLGEIRSVQAKVPDHTKTALLAATLGVATVSALYFAYISKAGPGGNDTTCGLDSMGDPIQEC
jgi:hypothetical protein